MNDIYILQKEWLLPGLRSGKMIFPVGAKALKNGSWYEIDIPGCTVEEKYIFSIDSVENSPEWFLPEILPTKSVSVYGIAPFSAEQIDAQECRLSCYIGALIKAEKEYPEYDTDGEQERKLLIKIAIAPLSVVRRQQLIILLINEEKDEE